jgi:hypothetical protein
MNTKTNEFFITKGLRNKWFLCFTDGDGKTHFIQTFAGKDARERANEELARALSFEFDEDGLI